jgi:hypothetical protein
MKFVLNILARTQISVKHKQNSILRVFDVNCSVLMDTDALSNTEVDKLQTFP